VRNPHLPVGWNIFAKSRTPLKSWFYAMFLVASTRCGISAKQMQRELGVTYKTAWRMYSQLRSLMAQDEGALSGEIEADKAYFGGQGKWKHGKQRRGRPGLGDPRLTPVFGMVQRGTNGSTSKVVAKVVRHTDAANILPELTQRVLPASTIYTDEYVTYNRLGKEGFKHSRVNHKQGVYVSGSAHVQAIEGFWSLVKRGLRGVYHSVSAKHLQSYLDEYAFRYNHRDEAAPMFSLVGTQVTRVRYGRYGEYHPMG
jgi:transposase